MTKKNTQRKKKNQVPVQWVPEEGYEVVATARPLNGQRPGPQSNLHISRSEGGTTWIVRQTVNRPTL